jgi:hypothetical protein
MMQPKRRTLLALTIVWSSLVGTPIHAQNSTKADVVVVVDTSTSMQQPDMDPHRAALLVTKLFADIVPGDLAVVRLLDIGRDQNLIPSRDTGQMEKCSEDPSKQCHRVEPTNDWYKNARAEKFGALVRPTLGDSGFKARLDQHLVQVINNSMFGLAFRSAQGVFDSHGNTNGSRMVVWLSDGNTDDPGPLQSAAAELTSAGSLIQPVVFGEGKVTLAHNLGLTPKQVRNPAELIKAFADTFRKIVQAPYEVDNIVTVHPSFEMKPGVDEAWVVVYGDDTLGEVTIETPEGPRPANYAQDRLSGAGAYRVFHIEQPTEGLWSVRVVGGGTPAYAVIQRSSLVPVFLEPRTAVVGIPVVVVARINSERNNTPIGANVPEGLSLEAEIEGRKVGLVDDGTNGDAVAHDGHYSGMVTFDEIGQIPITIRAKSSLLDKTIRGEVTVTGMFRVAPGSSLEIDLGSFKAPGETCRDFRINAEQRGILPFELTSAHDMPKGHRFEIRQARGTFQVGDKKMLVGEGDVLRLCLLTTAAAPSSTGRGEHWLDLRLAGSSADNALLPIHVRWGLQGLTWWQRWRWLVVSLIVFIVFLIWVYGYIRPKRFMRGLAVTFVPERSEVDDQTPQPIAQWSGTGISWYRDARACLHSNFRLNGDPSGAVAVLVAIPGGTQVNPSDGNNLYRETIEGNWEPIPSEGRRSSGGEVYRVGDAGPFFRVSVRKV